MRRRKREMYENLIYIRLSRFPTSPSHVTRAYTTIHKIRITITRMHPHPLQSQYANGREKRKNLSRNEENTPHWSQVCTAVATMEWKKKKKTEKIMKTSSPIIPSRVVPYQKFILVLSVHSILHRRRFAHIFIAVCCAGIIGMGNKETKRTLSQSA